MKLAKIFIVLTFLLAFAVCVSAQSSQFPNELEGYEFFGNGKLKDLQLTVSSKDDVRNIFGDTCEKSCDYDANWLINFEYFESIWITERRNDKGEKQKYVLDSKYLGKIHSIELRSQSQILFTGVSFPNTFQKYSIVTTHGGIRGFDKRRMSGDKGFQDSNGLSYEIYDYDSNKNDKVKPYKKGELAVIRYDIPTELLNSLFILQK